MKVAKENEKKPLSHKSSAKSEQSSADSTGRGSQKKKKTKAGEVKLGRKVGASVQMEGEGVEADSSRCLWVQWCGGRNV